jgi:hypothetical protein
MSRYIPVETPGGTILAEVEDTEDVGGIELVSAKTKFPSFEEAAASLRANARFLLRAMNDLAPDEVEVSCGIKVGAEAGNAFWGLAKASGEASYTVTLTWKAEEDKK